MINYSGRRRTYYIDELFNTNVPTPDWVKISQEYEEITDDQRELLYFHERDTIEFKRSFSLDGSANWEIEVEMNERETDEFMALIWGQDNNEKSFRIGYNSDRAFLIVSGVDIWGTMYERNEFDLIELAEWNKLTVRHIDQVYYVFFNEQFVYWFDSNGQPIGTVQSLDRGGLYHFRNVKVSRINL